MPLQPCLPYNPFWSGTEYEVIEVVFEGHPNAQSLRERYLADSITTASPNQLVTMLYDALILDMQRAESGFASNDLVAINDSLVHAQQIIRALRSSLRLDAWEGAERLASLYDYLYMELIQANVAKDRVRARTCASMISALADAWHKAAETVQST
jgi:flagellar protein FliS